MWKIPNWHWKTCGADTFFANPGMAAHDTGAALLRTPLFLTRFKSRTRKRDKTIGQGARIAAAADVGVNKKDGSLFEVILNFRHCQDAMIML